MNTLDNKITLRNEPPRAKAVRMLRRWVSEGTLRPGDVLPAEREISNRLGVGLATVQRALKVIEGEGLIVKHSGRTRTIAKPNDSEKGSLRQSVMVISNPVNMNEDVRDAASAYGWGGYVAAGVVFGLGELHLHALLLHPSNLDANMLSRMLASGARGLVIPEIDEFGFDPSQWAEPARRAGGHVVVFGDEPCGQAYDRVVSDHRTGAYELTNWLISNGRRAIRHAWPFTNMPQWAQERRAGYEQALQEAGLPILPPIFCPEAKYQGISDKDAMLASAQSVAGSIAPLLLTQQPVDAIMSVTDGMVPSLAMGLKMLGKRPNEDVWIVGYDDYWDQANWREYESTPPMATINKKNFEIGRELAKLLYERDENKLPSEPQLHLIPPTLKIRQQSPVTVL